MLLLSGRGKNTFISDLKYNLQKSQSLYVITAYASLNGLIELLPEMCKCRSVRVIVGDMSNASCQEVYRILYKNRDDVKYQNKYEAIQTLRKLIKDKRLEFCFYSGTDVKVIHSKGYLLQMGNRYIAYVGSANLSYPGFYMNKEWMVKLEDYFNVNAVYLDFMNEWNMLTNTRGNVKSLVSWESKNKQGIFSKLFRQ